MNTRREEVMPHPYTYLPARVVKVNGIIRWFDLESGDELPPFFGYGDDVQQQIDEWYEDRNETNN